MRAKLRAKLRAKCEQTARCNIANASWVSRFGMFEARVLLAFCAISLAFSQNANQTHSVIGPLDYLVMEFITNFIVVILLRLYHIKNDDKTQSNPVLYLLYNIQVRSYNQRVPHKLLIKQASL